MGGLLGNHRKPVYCTLDDNSDDMIARGPSKLAVIKECWTLKSKPEDIRSPLCKNPSNKSAILFGNYFNNSTWPITPIDASPNPDQNAHCGIENAPSEEIRGRLVCGQEALPHRFPWMAAIYRGDFFVCGSSIISKNWILTAAHCVEDLLHEIHLRVGAHDLSKPEKTALTIAIKQENVISHPEYNSTNLNNDIALLKLLNPLVFNETVQAVCLADAGNRERDLVGYKTTMTGWGRTKSDDQSHVGVLNYAMGSKVISNDQCQRHYPEYIYPGSICTDISDGVGICQRDSGGPLMIPTDSGQYKQIGVVSFGNPSCLPPEPQGFTRITHFLEWIRKTTSV